ncbi:MAG: hypothetical protein QOE70_6121 [Chthoniobacter sp.]|jgi:O-antigen/teichoic acid export membrane protein|nr:hypothetical protein [Chthoniobacter sp.]
MLETKKLLRGSVVITLARVGGYGLSFARNIILARLISKSDFGLAVMFGTTVTLLEVAGRMSFGQQLVQAKDGATRAFQATAHAFQFALALIGTLLLLGASYPVAFALKVPHLAWAFAALAVIPLARGFEHLDNYRQQRELNYFPAALCEVIPHVVITVAAWPLAVWLNDFRAIVWIMISKAVAGIVVSHLVAEQPYQWAWQRDLVKRLWTFGWPLLLTNILIFTNQQADQLLVGTFISLEALAPYALAFSLVSIPWFIFAQMGSSLMLPVLARAQDDVERFRRHHRLCVQYAAVGAVVLTLPLIISGEQLVGLAYGSKYSGTGLLVAFLGAAAAVRFLRFAPAVAAMARGDTVNQLYSNLWRGVGLPLALAAALAGGGVALVATCAAVGEVVAGFISVQRLAQRQRVPMRDTAGAAGYVASFVGSALALVWVGASHWELWLAALATTAMIALSLLVAWVVFPASAAKAVESMSRKPASGLPHPTPNGLV